ncbi:thiamine phosphate synthase [Inmirania thermothiophila]|uniref:Thiamine-phosphate synthase n=1 Tax=Inmirania thermothiophila TaxID=1750597 RepID=A0A3N1Y7K8_9GAMM|nr:thiamine phosphate synthase [Inmirania thermothiophila]ROR34793.1 thiamine-phosphate diphosphorylase [Inmirania thermothiophila]
MTGERPLCGLYVLTDGALTPGARLLPAVAAAIRGGARLVQYRDKGGDARRRLEEATALAALCRRAGVPLVVNDDPALARAAGAAGVHLGADDPDPAEARRLLGPQALVGVSCYDSLARAEEAAAAGADYVAFGSFFPSRTKPAARRAPPALLQRARARLALPLVAIGGITPDNGAALVAAGADLLAVVHGVFGAADIEAAARRYAALFEPAHASGREP